MAERLRWWVIPGAMIVLWRVVTLDQGAPAAPQPDAVTALAPGPTLAVVRDASGQRSSPVALGAAMQKAFVVVVPGHAGEFAQMTLWRRLPSGREATPWLTLRPRVRDDAVIPMAGLQLGSYDVEVVFGDGRDGERLTAENVTAPGVVTFADPAPGR